MGQIRQLSVPQLEALAESLLDFRQISDLEELKKYIERREVKPPALKLETKMSLIEPSKLIKPVKPVKPVKPIKPIKPVIKKIVIPKINLKYQNQQEREVEKSLPRTGKAIPSLDC